MKRITIVLTSIVIILGVLFMGYTVINISPETSTDVNYDVCNDINKSYICLDCSYCEIDDYLIGK